MRRRTESGRHFSSDEEVLGDDGSGSEEGLSGSILPPSSGTGLDGDSGFDTPRGSFSIDEKGQGLAPQELSQALGLKIGGAVSGPGDFRRVNLMMPKQLDQGLTKNLKDLKVDISADTPPPPPVGTPLGTPVGTPTKGVRSLGSHADTPSSSSSSSGGEGPSLPPGIPVRRRRSSAARESARSIALAKKSQHIVSNLEAAQQAHNPSMNVMQKNKEKAEAEEERRLALEEKAIRHKRAMERSLKKQQHHEKHHHHHRGEKHHHHHHSKKSSPSVSSGSDVSDLSDGYEGGEDNNDSATLVSGWNSSTNSETSDDDAPITGSVVLPPRSRNSSRGNESKVYRHHNEAKSPLCVGTPPMGQTLNGAPEQLPDLTIRILLLGDSGVGKTSLMMRYSDDKFAYSLIATAGVDFKVKNMDIPNPAYNKSAAASLSAEDMVVISEEERELRILRSKPFLRVRCQIWDTAGQEKFHTITRAYYRGAHAIVTCFDVTDSDSFKNIDYWLANIHTHTQKDNDGATTEIGGGGVQTMIIGNKTDLHHKRTVTKSQGEALAKECGIKYIETSAKDGTNVQDAFKHLATDVVAQLDRERRGMAAGGAGVKKEKRGSKSKFGLPAGFLSSKKKDGSGGKKKSSGDNCVLS